jgi:hypothetical protein
VTGSREVPLRELFIIVEDSTAQRPDPAAVEEEAASTSIVVLIDVWPVRS